jgi:glutamyl-tRNA synthetase
MESILDSLKWLGLDWDEGPDVGGDFGPYLQSQRLDDYRRYADGLLESGLAYRCFCREAMEPEAEGTSDADRKGYDGRCRSLSPHESEELAGEGKPFALRFKVPKGQTVFYDVNRGKFEFDNAGLEDFVFLKNNGMPTYNFAVTVDDALMEISHVIRGDDHISNTPRQVMLFEALGFKLPKFVHVPMILGPDRSRLSKRHGTTSVENYRAAGILPEGLVNYLAILGCSYDQDREIYTIPELIKKFSLKKVSKNPVIFDPEKLEWVSSEHFKNLSSDEKIDMIVPVLAREALISSPPSSAERAKLKQAIDLVGNRLKSAAESVQKLGYFFHLEGRDDDAAGLLESTPTQYLTELADRLESTDPFGAAEVEERVRRLAGELDVKAGDLIHPLRASITGMAVSPDVFGVASVLGRQEVVRRLRASAK